MQKYINIGLMLICAIAFIETSFNLLGRVALIENHFKRAKFYLSLSRDKELLGFVFYKQDKFDEAFNYYKERKDWRGMGWAYYGMGKYDEAQDYFKRVNDNVGIGQVKLAQGDYAEAKKIFKETSEYSGLGLTYLADNDFENAKNSFMRAGDNFGLGLTLLAKGDFASSLNIFSGSGNNTVKGLNFLMENKFNLALTEFEKIGNNSLLASYHKFVGNYSEATKIYTENNNISQIGSIMIHDNDLMSAYNLYDKNEDSIGLGDTYFALGDYERAHELYAKQKAYDKAIQSLLMSGNLKKTIKFCETLTEQNPDDLNIKYQLCEIYRLSSNNKKADYIISQLEENDYFKIKSSILKARIRILKNNLNDLSQYLQDIINKSGTGFLSSKVLSSAKMLNLTLTPPQTEKIEIFVTGNPKKIFVIILLSILASILITFLIIYLRNKMPQSFSIENLQVGMGGVSQTHKIIYSAASTSLKLSTVAKIQNKYATPPPAENIEPQKKEIIEDTKTLATGQEKIEKSGVQVLQIALKKLGVTASAFELMELAGEETGKLTVYGIYLAARAKGVQVQGIKVDVDYLMESVDAIHLIFFHDETFALLNSINSENVLLTVGANNVKTLSVTAFKEQWNGYVITISKF